MENDLSNRGCLTNKTVGRCKNEETDFMGSSHVRASWLDVASVLGGEKHHEWKRYFGMFRGWEYMFREAEKDMKDFYNMHID
jgi:hypothetical protein